MSQETTNLRLLDIQNGWSVILSSILPDIQLDDYGFEILEIIIIIIILEIEWYWNITGTVIISAETEDCVHDHIKMTISDLANLTWFLYQHSSAPGAMSIFITTVPVQKRTCGYNEACHLNALLSLILVMILINKIKFVRKNFLKLNLAWLLFFVGQSRWKERSCIKIHW